MSITKPLEGLEIMVLDHTVYGNNNDFVPLDFAAVYRDGQCFIYYMGETLGPVERAISPVEVDYTRDIENPPRVVKFGEGEKVGVFINGVKSDLYDEVGHFSDWENHFYYCARNGDEWFYVTEDKTYGGYQKLGDNHWALFDGKDMLFYAVKDGKVGYWLNGEPLELYDAETFEVSHPHREGRHTAFVVTRKAKWGVDSQEGVWVDGKVERWFSMIKGPKAILTEDGIRYVGMDKKGQFLFLNGEFLGPFEKISYWHSSYYKLKRGTLAAIFTRGNKSYVRVGDWLSGEHKEIKKFELVSGHRLIIGVDTVRGKKRCTYYVDEKKVCEEASSQGIIKGGRLTFVKPVESGYDLL